MSLELDYYREQLRELDALVRGPGLFGNELPFDASPLGLLRMDAVPGHDEQSTAAILQLAKYIRRLEEVDNLDIELELAERARTMAEFTSDHRPIAMYAIYRADLEMPPEKLAAQCGHAYVDAHKVAEVQRPSITAQYPGTGHGTKLCMRAKNKGQLLRAYRDVQRLNLPHALIYDRAHVLLPHFDGKPLVTALGIGPVYKDEVADITKRYTMSR